MKLFLKAIHKLISQFFIKNFVLHSKLFKIMYFTLNYTKYI